MDWDDYYMNIAFAVREKANCKGRKVGAVIVKSNRIVSTGYNGTPEGMDNCMDGGCCRCNNKDINIRGKHYDMCICVHAEQNAVLSAARFGISIEGGIIYTTLRPCFNCSKAMLQTKIQKIVYRHDWYPDDKIPDIEKQYESLQSHFSKYIKQVQTKDSREKWAGMKK